MLTTSALDLLKTYYGYEQFRHPQEDIIHDLVAGQDLLVLMPTGGGGNLYVIKFPHYCAQASVSLFHL